MECNIEMRINYLHKRLYRTHVNLEDILTIFTLRKYNKINNSSRKCILTIQITLGGVIKIRKALYQTNGTEDHIHTLSNFHPTIALYDNSLF